MNIKFLKFYNEIQQIATYRSKIAMKILNYYILAVLENTHKLKKIQLSYHSIINQLVDWKKINLQSFEWSINHLSHSSSINAKHLQHLNCENVLSFLSYILVNWISCGKGGGGGSYLKTSPWGLGNFKFFIIFWTLDWINQENTWQINQ